MIITRFAPSPTGDLHIGSARTALFNYLFSRHYGGKFLLRIEDTDVLRSTPEATQAIFDGLKWLGLEFDESVVFQSKRKARHLEIANHMLATGVAYKCFTPQQEINELRQKAISEGKSFLFQSPWRDSKNSKDQPYAIRLKAPRTGITLIEDLVQGNVSFQNAIMDDMILVRQDGNPTYMLAVVVDDHDMNISHIIRGDDHLNNAGRQKLIYESLGWSVPKFAHIPLIHGPDGDKLSKRHGALGVYEYSQMGYLPTALCNYLMRLGWSYQDSEILSIKDAIKIFDIKSVNKSPARIDFEKMKHVNATYIRNTEDNILIDYITKWLLKEGITPDLEEKEFITKALPSLKVRASLITELVDLSKIYLKASKWNFEILTPEQINIVEKSILMLNQIDKFEKEIIEAEFKKLAKDLMIKIGDLMTPIRILMTGKTSSPSVFEIISILGREITNRRLSVILN